MCFYFILKTFSFKTWSSLSKLEKLHFLVIFFLGSNELVNCLRRVKVGCFLPVLFYLTDPSTSSFNWWSRSCFCLVQMNTTGIEVLRPLPCHERLPKKGLEYRIGWVRSKPDLSQPRKLNIFLIWAYYMKFKNAFIKTWPDQTQKFFLGFYSYLKPNRSVIMKTQNPTWPTPK